MSHLELSWSKLYLGSTEIVWNADELDTLHIMQWYSTGSALIIVKEVGEESLKIDLRADTDVTAVEYDKPDRSASHAVVSLKLLSSRPFPWAAKTTLDAHDPKNNKVLFQVELAGDEDHVTYEALTAWLKLHMNTGKATVFAKGEGNKILEEFASRAAIIDRYQRKARSELSPKQYARNAGGVLNEAEIERLQPGVWANCEIILYGLHWCRDQQHMPLSAKRCQIYHTQFYKRYKDNGLNSVKRWIEKYPLQNYEYCLFPINVHEVHWLLVIVDQPKYLQAQNDNGTGATAVYILNSLQSDKNDNEVAEDFKAFLEGYYSNDGHDPVVVTYIPKVPQQGDGSACGYWTIHFGKMFMERPEYYRGLICSTKRYSSDKCWRRKDGEKMRTELRQHVEAEMSK